MDEREKLLKDRIDWLTRAVRGILKMEFTGDQYYQMEVGRQDVALIEREKSHAAADMAVMAFMTEPSNEEAIKMLEKMFPGKDKP